MYVVAANLTDFETKSSQSEYVEPTKGCSGLESDQEGNRILALLIKAAGDRLALCSGIRGENDIKREG